MAPLELDDAPDAEPSAAFAVLKQKLELDFSFSPQSVKGKTTIEIQPQDKNLRVLQLNCRQLNITAVRVDGYSLKLDGPDADCYYSDLYKRLALYPGTDIHQHHFMKSRLQRHTAGLELELEINIPKFVEIRPMNAEDAARNEDVVAQGMSFDGEMYNPIRVEIEYNLENPRDAIHFVGVEDGDARYPHAFTRNSPFPGIASCLFPCVDDGATKCVFDVSIRYPRTLGDVYSKGRASPASSQSTIQAEDSPKADSVMSDVDDDPAEFADEEKALEMSVICSGELTDDISDPADPTRKTASFTCVTPVLPQHIGIAVGPFEHVDLSEYRDTLDDERLGSNAIRVHAFCLPGKADEVRNSAMVLARTLDSFTERYQSYPFEKAYKLAFVEDLDCDVAHSASFSICSSRLLFPESVWEPLEATTRTLIHAVASQWIGVNVTPQRPSDHWVIVGGSWFMTELYLRDLFGRNDHRFRLKLMTDKILQLDIRRPSLFLLGEYLSVDPGEAEFMALKAPLVLSILHHRLVKQSGKNGVDRCLYRLLFNARNEKLPNASISTDGFLDICEKVGHQKLDTFFNQWIYGSGCPTFECHPVFNKKKQVIQLTIKQTQADPMMRQEERALGADEVLREAKEKANGFRPSSEWPAFVGPMTIRIHEADGTPYEHIVDINSSTVKVEIPYNTKYKRLKKNRRDKERQALVQGMDGTGDSQEDAVFYMLGDLFQSEEESNEWKISEWSQEDYARMDQEFYEWIRVDADFEWICRANINDMPAYMYVSQLQQDKDVIAQAEVCSRYYQH
jgi:transcription initiation factor TFIID subunit 2